MRPDRPLICAVAALAGGVITIVTWCQGSTGASIGYPLSGSTLHIALTASGPAVPGGLALIALGLLLMAWALLAAFVSQIILAAGGEHGAEGIMGRRNREEKKPALEAKSFTGLGL
jgi:hypothetical protein